VASQSRPAPAVAGTVLGAPAWLSPRTMSTRSPAWIWSCTRRHSVSDSNWAASGGGPSICAGAMPRASSAWAVPGPGVQARVEAASRAGSVPKKCWTALPLTNITAR